jgi:hypothetical protein
MRLATMKVGRLKNDPRTTECALAALITGPVSRKNGDGRE